MYWVHKVLTEEYGCNYWVKYGDCHGYAEPAGFDPGFCWGPGTGWEFQTPAKPVPQSPGRRVVTQARLFLYILNLLKTGAGIAKTSVMWHKHRVLMPSTHSRVAEISASACCRDRKRHWWHHRHQRRSISVDTKYFNYISSIYTIMYQKYTLYKQNPLQK